MANKLIITAVLAVPIVVLLVLIFLSGKKQKKVENKPKEDINLSPEPEKVSAPVEPAPVEPAPAPKVEDKPAPVEPDIKPQEKMETEPKETNTLV